MYSSFSKELKLRAAAVAGKALSNAASAGPFLPPQPAGGAAGCRASCRGAVRVLSRWGGIAQLALLSSAHHHMTRTEACCRLQAEVILLKRICFLRKRISVYPDIPEIWVAQTSLAVKCFGLCVPPLHVAQVWALVGELRFFMPHRCGQKKRKKLNYF